MTAYVVVDPRAGKTGRDWPKIEAGLAVLYPLMTVAFTAMPGEAAGLVREALGEGHLEIVAVGGDSVAHEAVNGFFEAGGSVSPDAVLALVSGEADLARLKQARARRIDIGRVSCLSFDGVPQIRYFANIASFGLSGRVAESMAGAGPSGSEIMPLLRGLAGLLRWRARRIRLITDTGYDEIMDVRVVTVATAKSGAPGDGLFDIAMTRRAGGRILADLRALRAHEPASQRLRAARLVAAPLSESRSPVRIETDGEIAGVLPASFEILPNALNLRC